MADTAASRTIRLVRSPIVDGVGVFPISAGPRARFYTFHEVVCAIGGRGAGASTCWAFWRWRGMVFWMTR